jgi:N-acetylneuraminic acid mutarotase
VIATKGITRPWRGGRSIALIAGLLSLVAAMLAAATPASAAASGSWAPTGTMISPHASATATLLPNGKVLVAGGYGAPYVSSASASAELYNPATGTWAATGSMTTTRGGQTATLLASGKVLVARGTNAQGLSAASAELYDPATGTWAATGPMASAPGSGATATLLPDGSVLVAGGCCVPGPGLPTALASAQIYNPVSNTWAATASMSTGRGNATATLLGNGTVLVAGGQHIVNESNGGVTSAEVYDPATGTWHSTGTMPTGHGAATASLLPDGQVLVAGGADLNGCCGGIVAADLYNPSTGTWQAAANMNVAREEAASVVLPDGTVLMTGGYTGITPMPDVASTEIYQPATNTWTPGPDMAQGRAGQTATLLPDGQVLVAGGYNQEDSVLATAELYSPGTAVNLIPDPGFESPAVPGGYWRSTLARTSAVAHSGTWSLAQTTTSSHGGWDLDADPGWYAPISPATTYQASIWVRANKTVKVDLNIDLLSTAGNYVSNASGPRVTLSANTWTQLTLTGIKPVLGEAYAAMQTHFAKAAAGTVIYWDDMSLTGP